MLGTAAGRRPTSTGQPTTTGSYGPKKSLGQHWLRDSASLEAMCVGIGPDDVVLEIGPGLGSLTRRLLEKAARVIAIEKDEALASRLQVELKNDRLEIKTGDILQFDLTALPAGYKVAANIPYYLTSNLIRILSESANPPASATLLVQKEVAERLAAKPGQMSILSITAQFYWQVSLGRLVEAALFEPPPKVDSQIVVMSRHQKPLFDVDTKKFFQLIKTGFAQKRKTLTNNLISGCYLDKSAAIKLIEKAGLNPQARPQTLSIEDWQTLFKNLPTKN